MPHVSLVNALAPTQWHQWVTSSKGATSRLPLLEESAHGAQCNTVCPGQLPKTPEGNGGLLPSSQVQESYFCVPIAHLLIFNYHPIFKLLYILGCWPIHDSWQLHGKRSIGKDLTETPYDQRLLTQRPKVWDSLALRVKLHSQKANHFCEPSPNE